LRYLFEDYALDTDQRELHRGSDAIPLAPQVFDILVYLIGNRARVVSKDDLIHAIWQGRAVSDAALTTRLNVARSAIGDSGEEQRLIKTLPRKGFRFIGSVRETLASADIDSPKTATAISRPALVLPDKPSIAVLPFTNLSEDPQQEYFADGVVEDIIAALSRLRWLFVIARNSSFVYKGKSVDIKQVGRELGVRYVLEGSVRRSADRLRIASQLVDTATGASLAANRFEGTLGDVFELQDRVTEGVVGAIAPKLEHAEIMRAQRKTDNLDAYDHFLRGMASYYDQQWSRETTDRAMQSWQRAIELDPDLGMAHAMAAMGHFRRKSFGWFTDLREVETEAARLARRAVQSSKDDAAVLGLAGLAIAYVSRELDVGAGYAERAIGLNPNLASTQYASGWIKNWLGDPEAAIGHFARAMRLSPLDPSLPIMQVGTAHAHFFVDRNDEASSWADMALADIPDRIAALRIGVASHMHAGHGEKARHLAMRLCQFYPAFRISNFRVALGPYRREEQMAKYEDALRQAGLPE
jgi:TolB-like protein/tetratricopeptide (TPR) repeat protein